MATTPVGSDPLDNPDHATLHQLTLYSDQDNTTTGSLTIPGSGGDSLTVGAAAGTRTVITDTTVTNYYSTGAEPYFQVHRDAGGAGAAGLLLGAGGATPMDVNLYRSAANLLKTDDSVDVVGSMDIGGTLQVDKDDVGYSIRFGAAEDTNLYRSAANTLKTDDTFNVGNAGGLQVSGTKVVGAQGAAVADATDAASAITQLNALLARLRVHGLIAT